MDASEWSAEVTRRQGRPDKVAWDPQMGQRMVRRPITAAVEPVLASAVGDELLASIQQRRKIEAARAYVAAAKARRAYLASIHALQAADRNAT